MKMILAKSYTEARNFIEKILNGILLRHHKVETGINLRINGIIKITGKNSIVIGDNCSINTGKNRNIIGFDYRTVLATSGVGKINIGNNVGISNAAIIGMDCITIEDYVGIGGGVKIWDTDFHSIYLEDRINDNSNIRTAPVLIKKGAFIGGGSLILKGVVIGENSVIGAGSVVAHDIPDNEIWAGNPIKYVKHL